MTRPVALVALAALAVASLSALAPAQAQIGNIFSDSPPRPPSAVPLGPDDEEDVPDLPTQGRILPIPSRPAMTAPPPGPVQSQPLPPPDSAAVPKNQNPPGVATAPGAPGAPGGNVANAPAGPNPLPGLPPGQRQPRGTPQPTPQATPPSPAALQPGDEIVTEPPAQKIVNKKAVFSGLDKITGRIINFDVDIGETVQFGALRVKPDACYTRPATEATNTDAFVEVEEITLQGEVKKIFSGWMFAASPGLHGVEHPIYDIWLTDCRGPDQTVASQTDTPPPPPKPAPPVQRRPAARPPAQPMGMANPTAPRPQPQPLPPPPQPEQQQQPSGFFPLFRQ